VHTGEAYVGTLGSGEKLDFSALGDTVNSAARLGSLDKADELLVSWQAWKSSGLPVDGLDRRPVTLVGRTEPLDVVHWNVGLGARNGPDECRRLSLFGAKCRHFDEAPKRDARSGSDQK